MAQIFISHIHEEGDVAKALAEYLKDYKLEAFLSTDNWQIRSGERWFDRITAGLNAATIVLLMLSDRSVARPWINFEGGWAWAMQKSTIPVCYGGLDKGRMPRPYSDLQGLNLRENSYTLVLDCYHYLKGLSPPPLYEHQRQQQLIKALDAVSKLSS